MAKSIRSKRKRMFRNIKRQRYAVKEMIRLKKMLGVEVTEEEAAAPPKNVIQYNLKRDPEVKQESTSHTDNQGLINYSFTSKGTLVVESSDDEEMTVVPEGKENAPVAETEMEHSQKKIYDPKTKKDQFGKYPAWFTQKDVKKQAKKNRLRKKITKKQEKLKVIAERKMKKNRRKRKQKNTKKQDNIKESGLEEQSVKVEQKSNPEQNISAEQNVKQEPGDIVV